MAITARYFRWNITRRRRSGETIQLVGASRFGLYRNGNRVPYVSNSNASNPGGTPHRETTGVSGLIDGSSTSYWTDNNFGAPGNDRGNSTVIIDMGRQVSFDSYQFSTPAELSSVVSPRDWTLEMSSDGNVWTLIDTRQDARQQVPTEPLQRTEIFVIGDVDDSTTTTTRSPGDGAVSLDGIVQFSRVEFSRKYRKDSGNSIPSDVFTVRNLSDEIDVSISANDTDAISLIPRSFDLAAGEERQVTARYDYSLINNLPLGVSRVGINVNITSDNVVPPVTSTTTSPPPPPPPTTEAPVPCNRVGETQRIELVDGVCTEFYYAQNPNGDGCVVLSREVSDGRCPTTTTTTTRPIQVPPPPAPINFRISDVGRDFQELRWEYTISTDRLTRFQLEVADSGEPWRVAERDISPNTRTLVRTGLDCNRNYRYRLRACGPDFCSTPVDDFGRTLACATTPAPPTTTTCPPTGQLLESGCDEMGMWVEVRTDGQCGTTTTRVEDPERCAPLSTRYEVGYVFHADRINEDLMCEPSANEVVWSSCDEIGFGCQLFRDSNSTEPVRDGYYYFGTEASGTTDWFRTAGGTIEQRISCTPGSGDVDGPVNGGGTGVGGITGGGPTDDGEEVTDDDIGPEPGGSFDDGSEQIRGGEDDDTLQGGGGFTNGIL